MNLFVVVYMCCCYCILAEEVRGNANEHVHSLGCTCQSFYWSEVDLDVFHLLNLGINARDHKV